MLNLLLFALVLFLSTACAVSPTGRQQFVMMPDQQLDALGVRTFYQLKREQSIERNRRINAYVQCVAQTVTNELRSAQRQWEVVVFEDPSVNAFALPGGKIGVHTGLLKVTENQHQLAAVIGHEIGHVLAKHANERMSQQVAVQGGLAVVGTVLGDRGSASHQNVMKALGLGAQYGILLPYSRVHESEADTIGLDLMARAGFDPRESVVLWRNMERSGGAKPPEFLSTHPSEGTRIRRLQAKMGQAIQTYQAARAQGKRPSCD